MTRVARVLLLLLAATASLFLPGGPAQAQQRRQPLVHFYEWGGEIGLEARSTLDERNASGQEKVEEDELILGQDFRIRGDGWAYHPAMLQFTAEVGMLLEQTDIERDPGGASSDVDGTNLRYDLNATMFPYKSYPTTFFANQSRIRINSPLAPSRTVDALRYGTTLNLRDLRFGDYDIPTRFIYRHLDTETSSTSNSAGDERSRDEFRIFLDNETEQTRNRLDYRWDSVESKVGSSSSQVTRQDLRLFQQADFDRARLTSRMTARDEDDTRSFQAFNLSEVLGVEHTEDIDSTFSYAYDWQDTDTSTQNSHTASAGLTQRLYESLSSSISLGGSAANFDTGDIYTWNGGVAFNYTKRIPGGRFGLRLSPNYAWQKEDTEAGIRTVVDESHSVTLTQDIILDNFLVVNDTIDVFEPVSGFRFTEGLDYDIIDLGVQTAIRIVPGGDLDPTVPPLVQTFAVNYDFETRPARTFSTQTTAYGASLTLLDHYSWDVNYSTTKQDLIDGLDDDPTLTDSKRLLARFDIRFANSHTHAEFERVREEITPRKRWALSQNFSFRPTPRTSLGLNGNFSRDEITDVDRVTETYGVSANASATLPFRVLAHLNLLARQLNQEEQDTFGFGIDLSLSYRYGRLFFELTDNFTWRKTETNMRDFQSSIRDQHNSVYFKVTREF